MASIYLDNAASVPLRPEVLEVMTNIFQNTGNASSTHHNGRFLNSVLETAREEFAEKICVRPRNIIFTSGGTEANNTVLQARKWQKVIISCLEHESVRQAAEVFRASDCLEIIPVLACGTIDLDKLESCLQSERTLNSGEILVSILAVHGETGILQPFAKIASLCQKYGAFFHCDAVQYFGHSDLNIKDINANFVSLSAHKIGGPQGVGALVLGAGSHEIMPLHKGGGQERGYRSGTSPVALIAGFTQAVQSVSKELKTSLPKKYGDWRKRIINGLKAISSDIIIYGDLPIKQASTEISFPETENKNQKAFTNTIISFATPGWFSQEQVIALDLAGLSASFGSACSSGKNKVPTAYREILKAQKKDEKIAETSLRISMGWANSDQDIEAFLNIWRELYFQRKLQKRA